MRPEGGAAAQALPLDREQLAGATIGEVLARLQVDPARGLDPAQVRERIARNGFNEVAQQRRHPVRRFLRKFWGLSAWMLEAIMLLSALLGHHADVLVVGVLLLFNAVLGFVQEARAAGVVESLRQRLQVSARVLRDGEWSLLPARELVPGDVLRVRAGDLVPADLKALSGPVRIDASALTGESAEITRAAGEILPAGALVRHGEADAVVVLTGRHTRFGQATELVQRAQPRLHIEAVVSKVVRWLLGAVSCLVAVVLALCILRGVPLAQMAPLLLVLLMSAVPVALPVMFTVSLAMGSRELARRGVLVTRLSAIEDAATMDVLCVDKTGTLTLNVLRVTTVTPFGDAGGPELLRAAALASQLADQDPVDAAVLDRAAGDGVLAGRPLPRRLSFVPFDARTRRTEAMVDIDGQRLRVVKGALNTVAGLCDVDQAATEALQDLARAAAGRGLRTLAVAAGPDGGRLRLLGLLGLEDPPRPDARALVDRLRALGVAVRMLTGDALGVARAVGVSVGLPDIRPAELLRGPAGNSAPLPGGDGFAEVYPEDKFNVVLRLQGGGHVAGMTGDGVNDAPALRQAEVGIAVSTATDVAKGAASAVLTQPGLTDIVALVEQGRVIYQRVLSWIVNKVSRTILKAAYVGIAFAATGQFVVSTFAMLLLVFLTDFAKIGLASDRVRPSAQPETWNIGGYLGVACVLGVAMVGEALALLELCWVPWKLGHDQGVLHTFSFLLLLYLAVFSILSARERRAFWRSRPSAVLSCALVADALVGTVLGEWGLPGLSPLPAHQVLVLGSYALIACLGLNDALKVALLRRVAPMPDRRQG